MYYHSTRNNNEHFSASEAILKGLADDGGLFVPSELPNIANRMDELAKLPYAKLCHQIICEFFEEFKDDKIFEADIIRAYDKFDSLDILELKELDGVSYMELYHGPTCAFKDFACLTKSWRQKETPADKVNSPFSPPLRVTREKPLSKLSADWKTLKSPSFTLKTA